jgi:hypothetical protein
MDIFSIEALLATMPPSRAASKNGVVGKLHPSQALRPPTCREGGRSQPVDATPSDLDHFSEVVFMRQGRRHGLSAEQKAYIWQRWKAGESLHAIGRAVYKDHGSIQFLLSQHGGIAPSVRRRAQRTLTLAERKTSRELLLRACRFVRSPEGCNGLSRR